MPPSFDHQADLVSVYSTLFKLLSRIYLEPPEYTFICELNKKKLFKTWPGPGGLENLEKGKVLLKKYFKDFSRQSVSTLTADYYRLFVGFDSMLAPPYESVYLSDEHILFDPVTLKVRDCFQKSGLAVNAPDYRPDDHLGYELTFISFLCKKIRKDRKGDPLQAIDELKRFLDSHLLKWIGLFVQRVMSSAEEDYFKGVALLTLASLETLRILINQPL